MIIMAYGWINFLNWFFNIGIVTNKRIFDIDFHSLIQKEVTATEINDVQEVTSKTTGFFSSFFNFGNIFVQTAGKEVNIEFLQIPQPIRAAKIINELREEVIKNGP